MDIRRASAYAAGPREHYRVEHQGIHALYLMTLIRVADYLDLYAERASGSLSLVVRKKSRYSQTHWDAHQAVTDIKFNRDDDPEVVELTARPMNIHAFEMLRSWLAGIQAEIDLSWACLGDRYGRNKELRRLGLAVRRVSSNLDDPQKYAKTRGVSFIPTPARLSVSGPDVMRLLVKPLYGDEPAIGVRELMQNAVDAVRELEAWCERRDGADPQAQKWIDKLPRQKLEGDADVVVALCGRGEPGVKHAEGVPDDWERWLEVSDRGIGMTPRVINEYFLRAGASYRQDPEYARAFSDDQGRSVLARSGRFGVGVFAAFLLGDTIKVRTRAIDSEAIEFETRFDGELINLRKVEQPCGIGTTVWVKLGEQVRLGMIHSWNTFVQEAPPMVRCVERRASRSIHGSRFWLRVIAGRWRPRGSRFPGRATGE